MLQSSHMISPPLSKPVSASSISTQERESTMNTGNNNNATTGTYHHHQHHHQSMQPMQQMQYMRQMSFERFDPRSRPASAANGAPIGQRVSGIMRANQEGGEEKRQSKPRMSVMSRLSRAVEDSTGRRPNSRSGQSITLLTRQSHLSSSIGNNSNQDRLSLQKQQYQSHASVVASGMAGVPEEPDQLRTGDLVPKLLNWVNRYLAHAGYHANDLVADLRSGQLLLRFMEELSGYKLASTIPEARETGRPVDDMSTAFHFLHKLNVDTKGYTTADILVGNEEKVVCMLLSVQQAFPSSVPADFYQ
ncbi:hypothetical protein BDF22DRAFT_681771 [Syncephalis plumigaleata]|nr:hypothetical protein BDF22DRAFT_681771 [Syncephalis plumigaleata]